ncbi:MAG TPA: choice-of-anchor tandem repeat GloVer-containing protein [Rhizomicrobium sp.]|jgi:uncharacterized repeat protein (TIGR03803 family)
MRTKLPILAILALAVAPAGSAFGYTDKNLHDFCSRANCTDGSEPTAGLVMDNSGILYGTTFRGGKANTGEVFELVPDAGKYKFSVLHDFGANDGYPDGELILDKEGNLYGTFEGTGANVGAVFGLTYNGTKWKFAVLHQFSGADGEYPQAGLTYAGQTSGKPWDDSSPLFGTVASGGTYGNGVAFELVRSGSSWTETVIHNFEDSAYPNRLLEDTAGNLWGTTQTGGKYGGGLMFKLASGTWTETVFHNFCNTQNCADGSAPFGQLSMDSSGNVYGTTSLGGTNCQDNGGCGVVFQRTSGGTYLVLYNFCSIANCGDGETPLAGVILDSAGHLFGTTLSGGINGLGTAFELATNGESAIYSFCAKSDCSDGERPAAPLIMDSAGRLFGTTSGLGGGGNAFELKPK